MSLSPARLWWASVPMLAVGGLAGLALSYDNLVQYVEPELGPDPDTAHLLAMIFPLVVDVVISGAALAYLATCLGDHPRIFWRVISQGAVIATLVLNAGSAHSASALIVHLAGPACWAALTEAVAAQLRGDRRTDQRPSDAPIPLRLWVTATSESLRTYLQIARRLSGDQAAARLDVGRREAAVVTLRETLPGRDARKVRRTLTRQLRIGSLTPDAVLTACMIETTSPGAVLRSALGIVLAAPQMTLSTLSVPDVPVSPGCPPTAPDVLERLLSDAQGTPRGTPETSSRPARPRVSGERQIAGKAAFVRDALAATDGTTDAALTYLADRNITASAQYVRKIRASDARETSAPDARETSAPDARETSAPDARETSAPDARETSAPDARETSAPDARETSAVPLADVVQLRHHHSN